MSSDDRTCWRRRKAEKRCGVRRWSFLEGYSSCPGQFSVVCRSEVVMPGILGV